VPPAATPLDLAVWERWLAKGRSRDEAATAVRLRSVKCVSIAALLAAGLWPHATPYEVVVRFLVSAGAIVVMVQAFKARFYVAVGIFGALALLYNPVAIVFPFAGAWQRAFVTMSAVPFAASLVWRGSKRRTLPAKLRP